jgi:dTDP-4-dehydrorhamnose 3,5-epimerase
LDFKKPLKITETNIPGLLVIDLPVHDDIRGWFKESWQRAAMTEIGLPDFAPVQNNVSFNNEIGTTRGIHAEPWDKYISVASGRIFGAWVDLRQGNSFGEVFTMELDPTLAIFVPRGVGNSFQTLAADTVYSYLVNDHWRTDASYIFLNLNDPTLSIPWPIPIHLAQLSEKDKNHPMLSSVIPFPSKSVLVLGKSGQLGKALAVDFPDATFLGREECDFLKTDPFEEIDFRTFDIVINATGFTAVDGAEVGNGVEDAWKINATSISKLVHKCRAANIPLVHVSTDYVFDGKTTNPYSESAAIGPISVYGQSKAAGDLAVQSLDKHYLIRTSWVIGDGGNFVRTIRGLLQRGIEPEVVNDQIGRLSFAKEISRAISHLISTNAAYGTYNVTNDGPETSWFEVAQEIRRLLGLETVNVTPTTTEKFYKDKIHASRPAYSVLDLSKLKQSGFVPRTAFEDLNCYLKD